MRFLTLTLILNILLFQVYGEELEVGQIILIKGEASVQRNNAKSPLSKGSFLNELDIVTTGEKSLIKISFLDRTNLILGPNSELQIKKYSKKDRRNIFNFIRGNFRAKIQEKVSENQSVQFLANQVSVGVRGTEFLANSYIANAKGVSDVALLEGNLKTTIAQTQEFTLKAGEAINTNTYQLSKEVRRLDPKIVEKLLSDELSLLPNLADVTGKIKEMKDLFPDISASSPPLPKVGVAIGSATGALGLILGGSEDEKEKEEKEKIKIQERRNLKKEPSDIRDAILRREELRADNQCFYWFYKSLPGSGELERFRRERDCDEFDYDL
ncbi:FecR family protein [Halobacteriovorax sp. JY17]|uniref:FecR family protein n=1 Tax=Halobacteriovorax sp. JY17 TaxID=2014617 RepID=UPI000C42B3E3|nr:FecR family protein [Halobacteriovorax sp. JY17]PIK16228.1 MAG: hypothetical protein CES88_05695 [Halobacteriovorax sp. JY17]